MTLVSLGHDNSTGRPWPCMRNVGDRGEHTRARDQEQFESCAGHHKHCEPAAVHVIKSSKRQHRTTSKRPSPALSLSCRLQPEHLQPDETCRAAET